MIEKEQLWQKTLEKLEKEIPQTSFEMWILPLVPHSFTDNKLVLILLILLLRKRLNFLMTAFLREQ